MLERYIHTVEEIDTVKYQGRVIRVKGNLIESSGPQAVIGEVCRIIIPRLGKEHLAEVVALKDQRVQLMPYDDIQGIEAGCPVIATGEQLSIQVSDDLLGRVLDGLGHPVDGLGGIKGSSRRTVFQTPPSPLTRKAIDNQIITGVRSIDSMIPLGEGQRIGIFAGSGVGKSTLLGMIARNTSADINVIALIGERGREVREFLENDLGPEGLKRSVLVVSTGDTSALSRVRGAFTATTIAEYFRDQGKNVMLLFDSVTRLAMSQREIGLSVGEPPATRGYTPSVFTLLPKLLERSGTAEKGTITGVYTILVEGDDMEEPITDAVRGILDGHIVLSRKLAEKYHYPAIDVLASVSRLETKIMPLRMRQNAGYIRKLLALYTEKEDLISVGAYARGSNPLVDEAIEKIDEINGFLQQKIEENAELKTTLKDAGMLCGDVLTDEDLEILDRKAKLGTDKKLRDEDLRDETISIHA
ncbi:MULTISPECIES: FliI/YscN family ATPase [unclassified Oceanispirochaeta]|uniref:FliI/YscN family ATPase n=1 Tax=unclassified Oceanispirochaeta TaxID=2635722 RepID=UPI000E0976B2|nr:MULTISPECIES: FliI/YscN family ATPase [unclassified Oceanispirochaeta]MBF9016153.1 FliI/YscN family ATPase [Oceanispirochaeta sp. M2]NPD72615.1 FliI/YscN family ATPase [Oceanispirochaeta sp. M1]RDG31767.1 FliI/YscN family ATPase [Oceanispirochaeta sp. M1]